LAINLAKPAGCNPREWLPAMESGEGTVCMGATEAEAGSDLANLKTTFDKIEDIRCESTGGGIVSMQDVRLTEIED
jgi:alkylation response protein AidB-like acyl-CoA dehydrogenase